jgi:Transposase DDE domain
VGLDGGDASAKPVARNRINQPLVSVGLDPSIAASILISFHYHKAMRKWQVWVEPLFAEAKEWHGLRRFRLRGHENVNNEALLVAVGQVLKRFLTVQALGMQRHFQEAENRRCPNASELCA